MNKYDKVKIKDMPLSDYLALNEQDRETIDMYWDEVGIVMAVSERVIKVAFPSSMNMEMIHKIILEGYFEEERVHVYSVRYRKEGLDEFELFWLEEDALAFEEGYIEANYGTEVNMEVIK